MITVRKLKLTIVGDEETRNQQYKLIRDEQYQQYRALNLCMSLLSTYNILNNWNSGAENKLNSQIEKLNKKVEKNKRCKNQPIAAKVIAYFSHSLYIR